MGTATFILNLPAVFERDGDWTIARFPDIDVSSQGRTREEAERNLIEAAQLFIESCFERNTPDEVLKGCGFAPGHSNTKPGRDHLTVPVELLAARDGTETHPR